MHPPTASSTAAIEWETAENGEVGCRATANGPTTRATTGPQQSRTDLCPQPSPQRQPTLAGLPSSPAIHAPATLPALSVRSIATGNHNTSIPAVKTTQDDQQHCAYSAPRHQLRQHGIAPHL
ncbi:hypothetical protein CALCODRAFT_178848 [Calocera cornea HHB12733]|uniref:Uncharacterized protein n=1 Tax=Calocera cornea HHB12733 TaxID=1353952 RepID=A0A165CDS3_9BASI|nr:hypothetical protein CALCODRAFT_178848 [Calocera cornea HHB12733]